jgi:hypothetical protein
MSGSAKATMPSVPDLSGRAWSPTPEARNLRARVLQWLETMRADGGGGRYRLHAGVEPTVFASCFAVYLRHLLDDLRAAPASELDDWRQFILGHQDPRSGFFVDPANEHRAPDPTHDADHLNWQLTTFCLSALHALGSSPRYPLTFAGNWTPDRIGLHLSALDWDNPWNSGNKAMFLGIVLAYEAERGEPAAASALEAWFAWHDAHQNAAGFWGRGRKSEFIDGMGGAFHQFLIYQYCRRPIPNLQQVVDRVLFLQQHDGMYSPWPSGATCYELDAADILVHAFRATGDRREAIEAALRRLLPGVLSMQNADGGFCWGRRRPLSTGDWLRTGAAIIRHGSLFYWYYSLRAAAVIQLRRAPMLRTGWASGTRTWDVSSIFDTWFRCLTIAEVSTVLETPFSGAGWQFLETPGLGWFALSADTPS